ncbi:hypothetical protein A9G11_02340 [Gilliamella sp. wkB108]|uniref:AAA family ATPase n=1 Tax=Gilliamella sp. wkB108 TaxID=3120256 RepID=UPI00080E3642|nr:AAA family ATPase [Gilliamella apicola]OCG25483.1 hypothetical protein A9G11_02340 [Gilliamella apicola]
MKIESLKIENVGGISSLSIKKFDPKMNIICGENGIGKTNILDSIAHCFTQFSNFILKKKSNCVNGYVTIECDFNRNDPYTCLIASFEPRDYNNNPFDFRSKSLTNFNDNNPYLIYFKTERLFLHKWIESLNIYEQADRHLNNLDGVSNENAKDWFIKNELLSSQIYTAKNDKNSIEFAKKAFGILNQSYSFSALKQDMEIYVNTPTGIIPYEYLSSGFKTCISIVWGIIREVQIRFPNMYIGDFNGVILIDEIELHLHPEWQGKICNALTTLFPNVQFIISTHSPHVIQTAEVNEVIALSGQNGNLEKRTLDIAPCGFKGWTIEEILTDVMGMKDLRTQLYEDVKEKFDSALKNKDVKAATEAYDKLNQMLHPTYPLRALFKMQLDGLKG